MKSRRFFPLLLVPILLAIFMTGCQTLTRRERAVLQAQQVSPYVYNKMMVGDPLTLPDIVELSHRAVPPGIIIDYLEQTDARYPLRPADVTRLRKAGVSEDVISYLISTSPRYPGPLVGGPGFYPYGPGYYPYGPAWYGDPFFYGGPEIFIGGGFRGRGGWHDHGDRGGHDGGHGHHH